MKTEHVHIVTYSPTRTSWKITQAAADVIGEERSKIIDLTLPGEDMSAVEIGTNDIAVFGVPVYGGRVAPVAASRLRGIRGSSTPAGIIVLYGNREYEDALVELYDLVSRAGFIVVGAAAFIGEHSFSNTAMPIASGRPDDKDLEAAGVFGRRIKDCLDKAGTASDIRLDTVPGNRPYKDGVSSLPFGPQLDEDKCTLCGTCVSECPVGAISLGESLQLDVALCTICCACVKACPEEALSITETPAQAKRQWLFENCQVRKEPELILPVES